MKFKSLAWSAVLLLTAFVALVVAAMLWAIGAAWALIGLGVVCGVFLLAAVMRWTPLRDLAWAAPVGCGFGAIRWFDAPIAAATGIRYLLLLGACLLSLTFLALIAPGLLAWLAQKLGPPPAPELAIEKPRSPELLRRWDARD